MPQPWAIDKILRFYEGLATRDVRKNDISVVTAITGGKDTLKPQPEYQGVQYVAFTDYDGDHPQWIVRKACDKFARPVMNAKIHKILAHRYVHTPYIVWMDGNCSLRQDPRNLVKLMGREDFAFFRHPSRDCTYEEADVCLTLGRGKAAEIEEQVRDYSSMMFPAHHGLWEMTCFVRKNSPRANAACERWWAEVCRYSHRDQIAFPVAFEGERWVAIPGQVTRQSGDEIASGNEYFDYRLHAQPGE